MRRLIICILISTVVNLYCYPQQFNIRGAIYNDSIYHNPLFMNNPDIADVTVYYGNDGYYYMFGTGFFHKQYLYRSKNLVNWENTKINPIPKIVQNQIKNLPQPDSVDYPKIKANDQMWAPQIVKVNDKYNLYTSIASYGGIICLQSNDPTGPFLFTSYSNERPQKIVDLKDVGIKFDVIDPCFVRDFMDDRNYLFFGSSFGIYRVELNESGTKIKDNATITHVAGSKDRGKTGIDYEGAMLYWHSGYWYMILSPRRDYRLLCWRSATLTGDYRDKNGNSPFSDKYGWEILKSQEKEYKTPEGCNLYFAGHSGEIITDKDNRYFIFCHAGVTEPINGYRQRAVCLTEIAWDEDGWPYAVTPEKKVSYENKMPNM